MTEITIIDCDDSGWGFKLLAALKKKEGVTLINFDYTAHGNYCEQAARRFSMATAHDPEARLFRFRKPVTGKTRTPPAQ